MVGAALGLGEIIKYSALGLMFWAGGKIITEGVDENG